MESSLTVRNIMLLPVFRQSKVKLLVGARGILRTVQHVTVFESKEAISYMKGGELLLSAGYNFTQDPQSQRDIIRQLNQNGVAAILIKTGGYFPEIPSALIEECEQLDMPLFALPPNMSYRPIMLAVTQSISEAKLIGWTNEMNHLIQFKSDEDIINFCDWVEIKSKRPCAVVDTQNNIYHTEMGAPFQQTIINHIGRLCERGKSRKQFEVAFALEDGTAHNAMVFCIRQPKGLIFLIVFLENAPDDKNISSLGHMGIELLAHIFDDREMQYQMNAEKLFRSLNIIKESDRLNLESIRDFFGLKPDLHYCIVIAQGTESDCKKIYETFSRHEGFHAMYPIAPEQLICIIEDHVNLEEFIRDMIDKRIVWIGVGTAKPELNMLDASYAEASMALRMALQHPNGSIAFYHELGVLHLLSELRDTQMLESFVDKYIKPIHNYDLKHSSQLIETLQSYFANNLNARATAQALFIGKTTLMYRLNKIEGIANVKLQNFNDMLNVHIALLAAKIYKLL